LKKILGYLKSYLQDYYNLKLYLCVAGFLATCIFLNYYFDIDDNFFDQFHLSMMDWPVMALFQSFPFLVTCIFLYILGINREWATSRDFWMRFAIGFIILGFSRGFYFHRLPFEGMATVDFAFLTRSIRWASSLVNMVLPFILVNLLIEEGKDRNLYGLADRNFDWKPYVTLLLITSVFLAIGSFLGEIKSYYPRYARSGGSAFAEANGIEEWISVLFYELAYGSSFISVEMVFRGYMVMAFSRIIGGYAVVAMVTSYCFLHFGKPLGETISSIFGGYVLGIIAYYTRNIWGGIWIHMGVAWLMELFAYLQGIY